MAFKAMAFLSLLLVVLVHPALAQQQQQQPHRKHHSHRYLRGEKAFASIDADGSTYSDTQRARAVYSNAGSVSHSGPSRAGASRRLADTMTAQEWQKVEGRRNLRGARVLMSDIPSNSDTYSDAKPGARSRRLVGSMTHQVRRGRRTRRGLFGGMLSIGKEANSDSRVDSRRLRVRGGMGRRLQKGNQDMPEPHTDPATELAGLTKKVDKSFPDTQPALQGQNTVLRPDYTGTVPASTGTQGRGTLEDPIAVRDTMTATVTSGRVVGKVSVAGRAVGGVHLLRGGGRRLLETAGTSDEGQEAASQEKGREGRGVTAGGVSGRRWRRRSMEARRTLRNRDRNLQTGSSQRYTGTVAGAAGMTRRARRGKLMDMPEPHKNAAKESAGLIKKVDTSVPDKQPALQGKNTVLRPDYAGTVSTAGPQGRGTLEDSLSVSGTVTDRRGLAEGEVVTVTGITGAVTGRRVTVTQAGPVVERMIRGRRLLSSGAGEGVSVQTHSSQVTRGLESQAAGRKSQGVARRRVLVEEERVRETRGEVPLLEAAREAVAGLWRAVTGHTSAEATTSHRALGQRRLQASRGGGGMATRRRASFRRAMPEAVGSQGTVTSYRALGHRSLQASRGGVGVAMRRRASFPEATREAAQSQVAVTSHRALGGSLPVDPIPQPDIPAGGLKPDYENALKSGNSTATNSTSNSTSSGSGSGITGLGSLRPDYLNALQSEGTFFDPEKGIQGGGGDMGVKGSLRPDYQNALQSDSGSTFFDPEKGVGGGGSDSGGEGKLRPDYQAALDSTQG